MTPFARARDELRALGIVLKEAPGEYSVKRAKSIGVGCMFDNLDDALAFGRTPATQDQALHELPPLGPMKPKSSRRAFMYRHNRKVAAKRAKRATKA
jgi:hypothetical protein